MSENLRHLIEADFKGFYGDKLIKKTPSEAFVEEGILELNKQSTLEELADELTKRANYLMELGLYPSEEGSSYLVGENGTAIKIDYTDGYASSIKYSAEDLVKLLDKLS